MSKVATASPPESETSGSPTGASDHWRRRARELLDRVCAEVAFGQGDEKTRLEGGDEADSP